MLAALADGNNAATVENGFFRLTTANGWLTKLEVDPQGCGEYRPTYFWGLFAGDEAELEMPAQVTAEGEGNRLRCTGVPLLTNPQTISTPGRKKSVRLEPGHTLGQTFRTTKDGLAKVSVNCPTWYTTESGLTLTLYRQLSPYSEVTTPRPPRYSHRSSSPMQDGVTNSSTHQLTRALVGSGNSSFVSPLSSPKWKRVARKRFERVRDNSWVTLTFPPQPAGLYRLEMSEPVGTIGWWSVPEDALPEGEALADGKPVPQEERCFKATLFEVVSATVEYVLEENRLTLRVTPDVSGAREFTLLTPWVSEGTEVSDRTRVLFSRFFSDTGRYLPIQQLKRRDSLDFGMEAGDWLEATGVNGFDLRFRDLHGTLHWEMTTDRMALRLATDNSLTLELLPHEDRRPEFYPVFFSSDPAFNQVLNRFFYERAFSWPLSPALADWMEWLARLRYWVNLPGLHSRERGHLLTYKMDEEGYVYTWGGQKEWPFPDNEKYDARHFTTNANFILGCWRYYCWTHDDDFLRRNLARLRRAMEWQLTVGQGAEGLFIDNSPDHDGTSRGVHSNYWDDIPFGYKSAYENIYFYASLHAMAEMEEVAQKSGWKPKEPAPPARTPDFYRSLAARVHRNYDATFWNEEAGRYIGCVDVHGERHDYGFTYVNTEALAYGLGTPAKARRIYRWMEKEPTATGKPDTYFFQFAPRVTTLDCSEWWYLEGKAEIPAQPFDTHLENGGAILYTSFYDVLARARWLGADNAWERFRAILRRYDQPDRLCGGSPLYFRGKPYLNGWAVGTDIPFPESGLVPAAFLYAFLGVEAHVDGLHITPNLPTALAYGGVRNLFYRGLLLTLTLRRAEGGYHLEIAGKHPGREFRVTATLRAGETYLFRKPPPPVTFPPLTEFIGPVWQGEWIWLPGKRDQPNLTVFARRTFDLPEPVQAATVWVTADNTYDLLVNGEPVGSDGRWETVERYDLTALLREGGNVLALRAYNADGPGGLLMEVEIKLASGRTLVWGTDATWRVAPTAPPGWERAEFDDATWERAESWGSPPVGPWGVLERP